MEPKVIIEWIGWVKILKERAESEDDIRIIFSISMCQLNVNELSNLTIICAFLHRINI